MSLCMAANSTMRAAGRACFCELQIRHLKLASDWLAGMPCVPVQPFWHVGLCVVGCNI